MNRYCMALDLVDEPQLISEYEAYHADVWPEIKKSITDSGITSMEIYRAGNRLFMIMDTDATFSFERKGAMDAANPKVQEWEQLMWKYQQAIPVAKPGEKWVIMDRIFSL
ncbi:L-rhamnose mutarotase [Chitinophaga jiangningensis]|uniref:L-rhamnose mutarotase n=1 Tax=Chitinophaga jiangningensis TaxID=1419482 RepID=A0A1M6V4V1_9BACT|nr:L-rhamnose mutarotase [Chitinophaga jiangningensis]SHK76415.1 L-rhamnose mutarotase [Chitinophaga jiangningensis]